MRPRSKENATGPLQWCCSCARYAELARLTVEQIKQRDGRVTTDLIGNRGRLRTVPIPAWTRALVDEWLAGPGLKAGASGDPSTKAGAFGVRT
jgi:integrase